MSDLIEHVPTDLREKIEQLPACTQTHGWFTQLTATREWLQHLDAVENTIQTWEAPNVLPDTLNMFTDGSCAFPQTPRLRLATWSFVIADADMNFAPVSRGVVPGILQTVLRAELCGALSALWFLAWSGKEGILWVDNQTVYRRINKFQRGGSPPSRMSPNHDLWEELHAVIHILGDRLVRCVRVPSHETRSDYTDSVERWALKGNTCADAEALTARSDISDSMQKCWQTMIDERNEQQSIKQALHDHFLRIGQRAIQRGSTDPTKPQLDHTAEHSIDQRTRVRSDDTPVTFAFLPDWPTRGIPQLGACGELVHQWLRYQSSQPDTMTLLVTSYQLLISFQMYCRKIGPCPQNKHWGDSESVWRDGMNFNFLLQARWFARFLKDFGKALDIPVATVYQRPDSTEHIPVWCRCYYMAISKIDMLQVDAQLQHHRCAPYKRVTQDFANFPLAY